MDFKLHKIIDQFGQRLTKWVLANPWYALIFCLMIVFGMAPGLPLNSLSTDHRDFFGPDNPRIVAFDDLEETYTKVDNLVFVIRTEGVRALDVKTYKAINYITNEAWQLPAASRVDSLGNYQHTSVQDDTLTVEDLLVDGVDYTSSELAAKESIALSEPLLLANLISRDGLTSAVNVVAHLDKQSGNGIHAMMASGRELVLRAESKFPGTKVALTGSVAMSATFSEAGRTDATTLIPGMYLILLIALMVVYRSWCATLTTFIVVIASTIVPLGLMGYSGLQLTSLTIMAPIIIMTLAVADSVHILMTLLRSMRNGASKRDALHESLRLNFLAVSITSITTAVGFLCLNYADSPPFNHLGNLCAIGVIAAWFFSVVLLPAVILALPMSVTVSESKTSSSSTRRMRAIARFTTSHHKSILLVSVIFSIGLISQLHKLELNDNFVEFFDERLEFRVDTDFAQKHLAGIYYIHFDVKSGQIDGINRPDYLLGLDQLSEWMRRQAHVSSVYSYSDIAKRLNRDMHNGLSKEYRIPETAETAAQYLLLYELSLPYGLDMNDRINLDKSATRVTAILDNPTASQIRVFCESTETWLKKNRGSGMTFEPAGSSLLFSHISKQNIESMIVGNLFAIVLISIVMIFALNHYGLGLLSMLPNILPVVLALSVWTVLVGVAGMATAVVAAASLGIVVDNTTHFLSKYLRATRERSKNKIDAIAYSFETVGVALIANAIVLICGFSILAFSTFLPNFQMGILTALTIAIALLVDLICLPAILMLGSEGNECGLDELKGQV